MSEISMNWMQSEIAKRDARIAELEAEMERWADMYQRLLKLSDRRVLAEREACATLLPALMPLPSQRKLATGATYADGWKAAIEAYRATIRARPAP